MIFDGFAAQVSRVSRLSAKANAPLSVKVRSSSSTSSNADNTSRTGVKCTALTSKSASNTLNLSETAPARVLNQVSSELHEILLGSVALSLQQLQILDAVR